MAALAAILAVAPVNTAAAARKKNTVTATINGKRYKFKGRYVIFNYGSAGVLAVATKPARPGGTLRALGFGCAFLLPDVAYPFTPDPAYCTANYTETKVSRSPTTKSWFGTQDGTRVTYESFDGSRLTGTFTTALDPLPGNASPPVTIEGTFSSSVGVDQ